MLQESLANFHQNRKGKMNDQNIVKNSQSKKENFLEKGKILQNKSITQQITNNKKLLTTTGINENISNDTQTKTNIKLNGQDSSQISLSNLSLFSTMATPKAYDFDQLLLQLNNTSIKGTQIMDDNSFFPTSCHENKENIPVSYEQAKLKGNMSTNNNENKMNYLSSGMPKLGIQITSPVYSDTNRIISSNRNSSLGLLDPFKKMPNTTRILKPDDLISSYITNKTDKNKQESSKIKQQQQLNSNDIGSKIQKPNTIINQEQLQQHQNPKEKPSDGSTFINHSFANEKNQQQQQQGQPPNFSIDISKIEATNEMSFILSEEKTRECGTSRFRNDEENQKGIHKIYENLQRELDKKPQANPVSNERQTAKSFIKVNLRKSTQSNESRKKSEIEIRRNSQHFESINSKIQNSSEKYFKTSMKDSKHEIDPNFAKPNHEYDFNGQTSSSRFQILKTDQIKEKIRKEHKLSYQPPITNPFDKDSRLSLENRIPIQRHNSHSSQRTCDLDNLPTSKSSYDNLSDNGSVANFHNPYDLLPPSSTPKINNPNLKLDMKSVNIINELKEENSILKMELAKEREKVKKMEEMSSTITHMYQQIYSNQMKEKKKIGQKALEMLEQIKALKAELNILRAENQENFSWIQKVWPHIYIIFDYRRKKYAELESKYVAIANENKMLCEHLQKLMS